MTTTVRTLLTFDRNGDAYRRWDALPRPRELRSLRRYRDGRDLHRALYANHYTMLGSRRGRTLYRLAALLGDGRVPGALVDCGVWNGGSSVLMAAGAPERTVWAFDSFEGLPEPDPADGPESSRFAGSCVGSEALVRECMQRYAASTTLEVRPGWFEDTLAPAAFEIGPIGLLHCDGDWYRSVRLTLETLYPLVSPRGFIVIDDYGTWPGAKRATDEYRHEVGDRAPLRRIDHTGRWWKKPAPG
jgi:O-methyltransferase